MPSVVRGYMHALKSAVMEVVPGRITHHLVVHYMVDGLQHARLMMEEALGRPVKNEYMIAGMDHIPNATIWAAKRSPEIGNIIWTAESALPQCVIDHCHFSHFDTQRVFALAVPLMRADEMEDAMLFPLPPGAKKHGGGSEAMRKMFEAGGIRVSQLTATDITKLGVSLLPAASRTWFGRAKMRGGFLGHIPDPEERLMPARGRRLVARTSAPSPVNQHDEMTGFEFEPTGSHNPTGDGQA